MKGSGLKKDKYEQLINYQRTRLVDLKKKLNTDFNDCRSFGALGVYIVCVHVAFITGCVIDKTDYIPGEGLMVYMLFLRNLSFVGYCIVSVKVTSTMQKFTRTLILTLASQKDSQDSRKAEKAVACKCFYFFKLNIPFHDSGKIKMKSEHSKI